MLDLIIGDFELNMAYSMGMDPSDVGSEQTLPLHQAYTLRTQEAKAPSTTDTYEREELCISNPQWHLQREQTGH